VSSVAKAQGNFAKTPFAHLVVYLYQHRSTGTLLVSSRVGGEDAVETALDPQTAWAVLFRRGRAVAARLGARADSLEEGLLPFCELREAPYEFYAEDLVGSGDGVTVGIFDPLAFVARAARRFPRPDVVDAVLARFEGMRLRAQLGIDVQRLRLDRKEAALVDVVRAEPNDVESLCALSELSRDDTRRLLYVLVVTKLLTPYEGRNSESFASQVRERGGTGSDSTGPVPSGSSDSVIARNPLLQSPPPSKSTWQDIATRAAHAASIRPGASSRSSISFGAVRPASLSPPRASMPPLEALDPAGKAKRVEQFFQRSAYDEALPIIRALIEEDAKNASHHAALGYALLLRSNEGVPKEVVDAINVALRLDEDEPRALYTKAVSYKRMGKRNEALHYFKRTVAVDPGHIEAAREIRLMNIRAGDDKNTKR
jgi:tetratricopeptide (TPR) repeat protein